MPYEIELPDKSLIAEFEDGVKLEDADKFLRDTYPQAFKRTATATTVQNRFQPSPGPHVGPWDWMSESQKSVPKAIARGVAGALYTTPETLKTLYFSSQLSNLEREQQRLESDTPEIQSIPELTGRVMPSPEEKQRRLEEIGGQKQRLQEKMGAVFEASDVVRQIQADVTPEDVNVFEEALIGAAPSVHTTLAGVVASIVNPALGLAVGFGGGLATEGAPAVKEARGKGATWTEANTAGWLNGFIGAFGEVAGLKIAFKEARNVGMKLLQTIVGEGSQESITGLFQNIAAKSTYDPNLTVEEMGRQALLDFIGGGAVGAAITPAVSAAQASRAALIQENRSKLMEEFRQRAERVDADGIDKELYKLTQLMEQLSPLRAELELYGEGLKTESGVKQLIALDEVIQELEALKPGTKFDIRKIRGILLNGGITPEELLLIEQGPLSSILAKAQDFRSELIGRAKGYPLWTPELGNDQTLPDWQHWGGGLPELQKLGVAYSPRPQKATLEETIADLKPREILQLGTMWRSPEQAQGIRKMVESWAKIMKYDKPIILTGQPFSDSPGTRGRAALYGKAGLLMLNTVGIELSFGEKGIPIVAAHEFGHLLFEQVWHRSSPKMRDGMVRAWAEQYESLKDKTLNEALLARRSPVVAKTNDPYQLSQKVSVVTNPLSGSLSEHPRYLMSFREWVAHQMERALDGDFEGMQQPVKEFLGKIFAELKVFYQFLRASGVKLGPTDTYQKFLRFNILSSQVQEQQYRINELTWLFNEKHMKAPTTPALSTLGEEALANMWLPGDNTELGEGLEGETVKSEAGKRIGKVMDLGLTSPEDARQIRFDLDRFSKWKQLCYGILEIAKANRHIAELYNPLGFMDSIEKRMKFGYVDNVLKMHAYKMGWIQRATVVEKAWTKLSEKQQKAVNEFIVEEDLGGTRLDTEDPLVRQKYGLDVEGVNTVLQIRESFDSILNELENIELMEEQKIVLKHPELARFLQERTQSIQERYATLRSRSYFPHMWFGKHIVRVIAPKGGLSTDGKNYPEGSTVRRFHFAGKKERLLAMRDIKAEWGSKAEIRQQTLEESTSAMAPMPREFLAAAKARLGLDDEQQRELDKYIRELSPATSFSKRMMQRKGTLGFSFDLQRSFAAYHMSASNYLSKIKYRGDLLDARDRLRDSIQEAGPGDRSLRGEILNYVNRHIKYMMDPENDWASLRSVIAVAYLGAMPKSALMNLTQTPFVSLPYLTKKFGTWDESGERIKMGGKGRDPTANAHVINVLRQAWADAPRVYRQLRPLSPPEQKIVDRWGTFEKLTPEEQAFIEKWTGLKLDETDALNQWLEERNVLMAAVAEGPLDESLAMELAGMSEGSMLQRFNATNRLGYKVRQYARMSMVPFEVVEKFNRRSTFLAAYRLAKEAGIEQKQAYVIALEAVKDTQFEYAKFNRPELLRGKKGIFMMFFNYPLRMASLMSPGGDDSWKRQLAMMLLVAGPLGLPFMENLLDIWSLVATWLHPNERHDPRYAVKAYLEDFIENPDVFLHGISRYGFGLIPFADLSGSASLGRIIPGTDVLTQFQLSGDWDHAVASGVTEAGGATGALVMRMLQAVASDDPDIWRRVERGMPVTLGQSIMTSLRWFNRGAEELRSGGDVVRFDFNDPYQVAEVAAKAAGFTPRAVTAGRGEPGQLGYEELKMRRDFATYYATRRNILMQAFTSAVIAENSDARADALEAIRRYNQEVPFRTAKISGENLHKSVESHRRSATMQERGLDTSKMKSGIMREIGERVY